MSTEPRDRAERRLTVSPKVVGAVALTALAVVFAVQNADTGRVDVLFWSFEMPAWIWLLLVFLAGVVVGSVFPWLRRRTRQR